ncbi:MAG: DUF1653 domain-containing protein [Parachlamydiales bacterium]|jgi:hypothetical protein
MIATIEEQAQINQLPIGCTVQHYKGNKMKVLAIARHTEDHTLYVVYQKLYKCDKFGDKAIVIRPLKMFLENVNLNGQSVPRFKIVDEQLAYN